MKNLFLILFLASSFSIYSQNQDGEVKEYYSNGQLKKIKNYKNGKLDGLQLYYHINGELGSQENFREGKKDGISNFYFDNGNRSQRGYYKMGQQIYTATRYYKNGITKGKFNFRNGKRWNIIEKNDINGKAVYGGTLKEGNGTEYWYDDNGVLDRIILWEDGEVVNVNRDKEAIKRAKDELKGMKDGPEEDDFITEMEELTANMQADQLLSIESNAERLEYRNSMRILFDGDCYGNCKNGYGIYDNNIDGDLIQIMGQWKDNVPHGKGLVYKDGELFYDGYFREGVFHGSGKYYQNGELIFDGEFKNGEPVID